MVLTKSQIHLLYSLPHFDPHERKFFFSLNEEEIAQLNELRSLESRLHFILQLGYFKAKGILFSFTFSQASEDTRYRPDNKTKGKEDLI
jgi:hypothetical protein